MAPLAIGTFRATEAVGRVPGMTSSVATTAKWVGATIGTIALALVIYLGAVLHVYVLAWIIALIGMITG